MSTQQGTEVSRKDQEQPRAIANMLSVRDHLHTMLNLRKLDRK